MARFVPKDKMSKKAQKELNRQRRVTWEFSPVTKTVDSRKIYFMLFPCYPFEPARRLSA